MIRTFVCLGCGVEFESHKVNRRYCTRACHLRNNLNANLDHQSKAGKLGGISNRGTSKGYVKYEYRHLHRRLAEEALGRPLKFEEVVHHADGDPRNNVKSNLIITTRQHHMHLHKLLRDRNRLERECQD